MEISAISDKMSADLVQYSIPSTDQGREDHLRAVCKLGADLRRLMRSHPSKWKFGKWGPADGLGSGFIMVFPALLKDDKQIGTREIVRI